MHTHTHTPPLSLSNSIQLVGHLHVRVRRDANEEMILTKINSRLGRLVSPHMLTVQVSPCTML